MTAGMQPPWITYANKLKVLLNDDPMIEISGVREVESEDYNYEVVINVSDSDKYVALGKVLHPIIPFGNVKLKVTLRNADKEDPYFEIYETIFRGNPHFKDMKIVADQAGGKHAYARFYPEVLQFYNDDLTDYNGNWSGLAHEIAREIFAGSTDASMNFCTASVQEND